MKRKIPLLKITIRDKSEDEAVIDIDGEIGWVTYDGEEWIWNTKESIKRQLKEISKLNAKKIIVNISSLGGFVDDGLAIHDILAQHPAEIETRVIGMTASAATIIAQAGDIRKISNNALYLVHKAWGFAIGNSNDMKAMAADLDTIDDRIANIYAKRSGKDIQVFENLMKENDGSGKWIDAGEAEEYGLVDEVFEPMKAAAAVDPEVFNEMGIPVPKCYQFNENGNRTINIDFNVDTSKLDEALRKMNEFNEKQKDLKISENTKNKFQHKKRITTQLKHLGL
ncbi:MAG: Clp protease ClpP [Calditrichaeota bacterium]|nr:Clp protease ClpP [Calditrichota bacterium]